MNVTYPGISNILSADMIYRVGEKPSRCRLTFAPQADMPASTGDLVLDDGTTTITFKDCAIIPSSAKHQPLMWQVDIEDRRWKWRYGTISGHYNKPDGIGGIVAGSEKTPAELAQLLLAELNVSSYSTSALPSTPRPEVLWDHAKPAEELRKLCDLLGCVIVDDQDDDTVKILAHETGGTLPAIQKRSEQYSTVQTARPQSFRVVGEPLRFQSKFVLQAVGIDTDGAIKPIGSLSYIPAGGWDAEHPAFFSNVSTAARPLALQSVWRYYRVSTLAGGGYVPQGYPNTGANLTNIEQLLPLEDYLLTADDDPAGNQRRNQAYVEGAFWWKTQDYDNTAAFTRYPGEYRIDNDLGLVIFEDPVYKLSTSGTLEAADLYLVATHGTKVPQSGPQERYVNNGTSKGSETTEPQPIYVDGLQAAYVGAYSGATPTGYTDNLTGVNAIASAHLSAAHWPEDGIKDAEYGLLQNVSLDGSIHQIRWLLHPRRNPAASTRVWTNVFSAPVQW